MELCNFDHGKHGILLSSLRIHPDVHVCVDVCLHVMNGVSGGISASCASWGLANAIRNERKVRDRACSLSPCAICLARDPRPHT